jgi:hypothetical protein
MNEIISNVIDNSTWVSDENDTIFKFSNGKDLAINEENHLHYSLRCFDNKVEIQMGNKKRYHIDYINDFTLCLYNSNEKFIITPE